MKVSLALLTTPVLFTGCMQEKVSKVSPKSQDKNQTKTTTNRINPLKNLSKQTNSSQTLLVTNNGIETISDEKSQDILLEEKALEALALNIQNNMDIDINGNREVVTESLEVGENWEPLAELEPEIIEENQIEPEIEWQPYTKEDEVLETAKEYLGVPYVWAANGPSAFDCSGFTKYIYQKTCGITIPRYSGHQANVGIKVSYDELQKGDLVFFDTAKGFHGKVNHVGIYIGDNKFIHASSARKQVMITSFTQKKFYKNRFLHGRRILHSDSSFASNSLNPIHTN